MYAGEEYGVAFCFILCFVELLCFYLNEFPVRGREEKLVVFFFKWPLGIERGTRPTTAGWPSETLFIQKRKLKVLESKGGSVRGAPQREKFLTTKVLQESCSGMCPISDPYAGS